MGTQELIQLTGKDAIEARIHDHTVKLFRRATLFTQGREIALAEAMGLAGDNYEGLIYAWVNKPEEEPRRGDRSAWSVVR